MGAEHSQQRLETEGEIILGASDGSAASTTARRHLQKNTAGVSTLSTNASLQNFVEKQNDSRAPSPPLSVCSDLPYVSYTDRPIGENSSPKIKSKSMTTSRNRTGTKPKRPQTQSSHIVIVKPGAKDNDDEIDPDLARLKSIPQFLPVLPEFIHSTTSTRDPEVLERLKSQHLLNICSRLQIHLNMCASQVATEQNHLVERTKIVSNSITTLFASFVDMEKTYINYDEQFKKIADITEQLKRCNSMLNKNIESIEAINNFLDVEDRLEPFVWRTDDNKLRGKAEGSSRNFKGKELARLDN